MYTYAYIIHICLFKTFWQRNHGKYSATFRNGTFLGPGDQLWFLASSMFRYLHMAWDAWRLVTFFIGHPRSSSSSVGYVWTCGKGHHEWVTCTRVWVRMVRMAQTSDCYWLITRSSDNEWISRLSGLMNCMFRVCWFISKSSYGWWRYTTPCSKTTSGFGWIPLQYLLDTKT